MNELSLFSGYCGFTLGLRLAGLQVRTVGYVDNEPYIQKLIAQRIKDGFLDDAPIFGDIRAFLSEGYGRSYQGLVDVLTAGFPCQPHSSAGRRLGASDPRNLWPELAECIGVVRPRSVLLENVPGLIDGANPYIGVVVGDLARIGYDARWGLVPAAAVGAPHLRWRWWCLAYPVCTTISLKQGRLGQPGSTWLEQARAGEAYSRGNGEAGPVADANRYRAGERHDGDAISPHYRAIQAWGDSQNQEVPRPDAEFGSPDVPDAIGAGLEERQGVRGDKGAEREAAERAGWWDVEPALRSVADGTAERMGAVNASQGLDSESGQGQSYEAHMRNVWERTVTGLTPPGRQSPQQLVSQLADVVSTMPYEASLANRQASQAEAERYLRGLRKGCTSLGAFLRNPSFTLPEAWQSLSREEKNWAHLAAYRGVWHAEWPGVPRVTKGERNRVGQLKSLGNGIVPQCVAEFLRRLRGSDDPGA